MTGFGLLLRVLMAQTHTWPTAANQSLAKGVVANHCSIRKKDVCNGMGQTPVATVTGARYSVNMLSAINRLGEMSFMVHDGSVNAAVFIEFLKMLVADANGTPVFLIVDGHPMHKTAAVKLYIDSTNGLLKLFFFLLTHLS